MTTANDICAHCHGPVEIRIPVPGSGCDHLHYPDNCLVCRATSKPNRQRQMIRDLLAFVTHRPICDKSEICVCGLSAVILRANSLVVS